MLRKLLTLICLFFYCSLKENIAVNVTTNASISTTTATATTTTTTTSSVTTTNILSTLYLTMDPELFNGLKTLLPSDYNIENNLYTWNVTQIYILVNEVSPGLFFNISTELLVAFPAAFLEQLPVKVLVYHRLCYLLNETQKIEYDCYNSTNVSAGCPDPLISTKRYSIFGAGCGLDCKYQSLLWGYTDQDQFIIDLCKTIVCVIGSIVCIIVFIHQYWDSQEIKGSFCRRPFIAQSSFAITVCYSGLIIILLLTQIVGKNEILCQNDLNGQKTVSFGNPRARWTPCIVLGSLFFFCLMLQGLYTTSFSIALWHQFFAPLNSFWSQVRYLLYIDACLECINGSDSKVPNETTIQSTSHITANSSGNYDKDSSTSHHMSRSPKHTIDIYWNTNTCIGEYICNKSFMYHAIFWVIAIGMTAGMLSENILDAFHPFGVCFAGGQNRSIQFRYAVLPLLLSTAISSLFMPYALYLIWVTTLRTSSKANKQTMKELGWRLACFFFGATFGWTMITYMATRFWLLQDSIKEGANARFNCVITEGKSVAHCATSGYYVPSSIFYLFYFGALLAVTSSCLLSLHQKQIRRWKKILRNCPGYNYFESRQAFAKSVTTMNETATHKQELSAVGSGSAKNNKETELSAGNSIKTKETELTIKDNSIKELPLKHHLSITPTKQ